MRFHAVNIFFVLTTVTGIVIIYYLRRYNSNEEKRRRIMNGRIAPLKVAPEDVDMVEELLYKMTAPHEGAVTGAPSPVRMKVKDYQHSDNEIHGTVIRKLTHYKTKGFFLEVGVDVRDSSNTLFLENHHNWWGLLVDPDPRINEVLQDIKRKAWVAPVCASTNGSVYEMEFQKSTKLPAKVRCYPLHKMLVALGVSFVDLLVLNVGGKETQVLETIPFDEVRIGVVSVDYSRSRNKLEGVKAILKQHQFEFSYEIHKKTAYFMHKSEKRYQ